MCFIILNVSWLLNNIYSMCKNKSTKNKTPANPTIANRLVHVVFGSGILGFSSGFLGKLRESKFLSLNSSNPASVNGFRKSRPAYRRCDPKNKKRCEQSQSYKTNNSKGRLQHRRLRTPDRPAEISVRLFFCSISRDYSKLGQGL